MAPKLMDGFQQLGELPTTLKECFFGMFSDVTKSGTLETESE